MSALNIRHVISSTAVALCLSGCAVAPGLTDTEKELTQTMDRASFQPASRALRDGIETQEPLAQAAFWMREYELNPTDLEATIKLASVIRKVGNPQRAVEITQTTRAWDYPLHYQATHKWPNNGSVELPLCQAPHKVNKHNSSLRLA